MNKIVRLYEAGSRLGVTTQTIRNWIEKGYLPKPLQLGPRAVGWIESEFDQAISRKNRTK